MMRTFTTLTSHVVALTTENIDTDQIIPARFLKTISKAGLGQNLFADWCHDGDGRPRSEFPLNRPEAQGAQILLAGDNFGCGSSREHAPWALLDWGFRAVVSTSFADIFRNNALKNGLLPVIVDEAIHRQLCSLVAEDPAMVVTIDLARQTLTLPDGRTACTAEALSPRRGSRSVSFPIDRFSKTCLLEGLDQLGYLLKQVAHIAAYEQSRPARIHTRD